MRMNGTTVLPALFVMPTPEGIASPAAGIVSVGGAVLPPEVEYVGKLIEKINGICGAIYFAYCKVSLRMA